MFFLEQLPVVIILKIFVGHFFSLRLVREVEYDGFCSCIVLKTENIPNTYIYIYIKN